MLTSLDVPFADTRATDLSWWLGSAPAALDEVRLDSPDGSLTLRLLGASHQAVAALGSIEVPEVVACGGRPVGLPGTASHELPGARYRFESSIRRYERLGLRRVTRDLRARWADDSRAVVGVFPGSPDALTVLAGRPLRQGWSWLTWHVYPGTCEVVRTRSSLVSA